MSNTLKKTIAGALLSGSVAAAGWGLAGLALAAGTAQAQPGPAPQVLWCPGKP
jgi:hypothetical protein